MRSQIEHKQVQGKDELELELLTETFLTPSTTQRGLATKLRISLGLVNILIANLTRRGYLKITKATWRRRFYALTPSGLIHKMTLTLGYVERFVSHYKRVKNILREELNSLQLHAESRIGIYGYGEFTELLILALRESGVEEITIFYRVKTGDTTTLGLPILDISSLTSTNFDRIIIAELEGTQRAYSDLLQAGVDPSQVVILFGVPASPAGEHFIPDIKQEQERNQ